MQGMHSVRLPEKEDVRGTYNFDLSNPTLEVATDLFSHPFTLKTFD